MELEDPALERLRTAGRKGRGRLGSRLEDADDRVQLALDHTERYGVLWIIEVVADGRSEPLREIRELLLCEVSGPFSRQPPELRFHLGEDGLVITGHPLLPVCGIPGNRSESALQLLEFALDDRMHHIRSNERSQPIWKIRLQEREEVSGLAVA